MDYPPLQSEATVLRAVKSKHFDRQKRIVMALAFLRRSDDKRGLSVNYNCPIDGCAPGFTRVAIFALSVEVIRSAALDVIPDAPTHGNIVGLPSYEEREQDAALRMKAEDLADQLARSAHYLDYRV